MTPLNVNALMAMTHPAFAAMADFNGKLYDSAARFNTEWAEFLGRRLQEDFAVPQRLSACRSPQRLRQIFVDYWKTAFAQYQDEMGRLAKMSETFARQTASACRSRRGDDCRRRRLAA